MDNKNDYILVMNLLLNYYSQNGEQKNHVLIKI